MQTHCPLSLELFDGLITHSLSFNQKEEEKKNKKDTWQIQIKNQFIKKNPKNFSFRQAEDNKKKSTT